MKNYIFLVIFTFIGLIVNQNTYGQFERMDISYTVEEVVVDGQTLYHVDVRVENQRDKIIFSLYKEAPMPENLIKETRPIRKNTYRFENLTAGRYSVMVFESSTKGGYKSIDLGTNSKNFQE
jgi:hypothetical protein